MAYIESIPKPVISIIKQLSEAGFEAYIVGGCVRDLVLGRIPADWDITTNAKPDEIQKLFMKSVYENAFGTVGVVTESDDPRLKIIEITPYRLESAYSDKRHPDSVRFTDSLEEDLKRRDFTWNAMAIGSSGEIIDLFNGRKDLELKIVRAVGNPDQRFEEDALRLMRAVRLATQLGFAIEEKTGEAIAGKAGLLRFIAKERIRDEFSKLLETKEPDTGIELLRSFGLLKIFAPEIEEGWRVGQNKHHIYNVWEHNLKSLKHAADNGWDLVIRMAALLHDIAKPRVKQGEGADSTFYGHEIVGAKMTAKLLSRLRFPNEFTEKVTKLVRYHLFYYNVDEVTESSVRRLIRKVGPEDMEDLIRVRICDRIGSGVPKAEPYKLRHFRFLIEKLARDPISTKMLTITGNDIMHIAGIESGPKVGMLLNILLEEVLDDPQLNTKDYLESRVKKLSQMSGGELEQLAREAKNKSSALEEEEVGKIKKKHWVK